MTISSVSGVTENPRLEALKAKHRALSKGIDEARKRASVSDFYLSDLKKQKLLVKEKLVKEAGDSHVSA